MTTPPAFLHSATAADQETVAAMGQAVAAIKGNITGPAGRAPYAAIMQRKPAAPAVTFEAAAVGGIAGYWVRPAYNRDPASAVLFLHGGAYVLGSAQTHLSFVSQLVARTSLDLFVPDYRLAPEQPFPAAVEDALMAYRGLAALGRLRLGLAGDSAGGGLALVTLHQTSQEPTAAPAPRVAVVFSPWTDLALTSASMQTRAEADIMFTQASLASMASHYLQQGVRIKFRGLPSGSFRGRRLKAGSYSHHSTLRFVVGCADCRV
ncbi:alpha/beta hydrolase fold domain-containing protein, partial [Hymenobacter wooponensis]